MRLNGNEIEFRVMEVEGGASTGFVIWGHVGILWSRLKLAGKDTETSMGCPRASSVAVPT